MASFVLVGGLLWWWLQPQPSPPDLARYSPREALLFIEMTSLPAGLRRLETLAFWQAIHPAIGVPGQLTDILTGARLVEWLDVGPAEARLLARARWGLVVTGFAAEVVPPESQPPLKPPDGDGATLDVTPRLVLCLTSGLPVEQTTAVARNCLPLVARKLFGGDVQFSEQTHHSALLLCFRHVERPTTALWAAVVGGALLLANDEAALRACLDAAAGRRAALADLPAFRRARQTVGGEQALLFAFANPAGLDAALRLRSSRPSIGGKLLVNGQEQSLTASLLAGLLEGLGYGLDVQDGTTLERYHLSLHPQLVAELQPHLAQRLDASLAAGLIAYTNGVAVLGLSRPLTALDRLQTAVAARSNAAVAFVARELVAGLRERYGVRPHEPLDDALGDQWLLLSPASAPDGGTVLGVRVRDKARVLPTLDRYLRADGAGLVNPSPTYLGVPLVVSTHRDRRAACFLDDWLFVGDQAALERFLNQRRSGAPPPPLPPLPAEAFLHRCYRSQVDLNTATLALIALMRAGDPTPARLEEPAVRRAIEQQPPAMGYFRLQADGFYGELRSPIGNLAYLASFFTGR
ncbi:MAG: hypothetical protein NZ585_06370 [Chloracidobacterium sp.]|nr:hypothetical protein [Chloracidobacterium sp.]MDW8216074.1 hypothetical protein [Acidobacteriota bacterium]